MTLWRSLGRAAPAYSPRHPIESAIIVPEDHGRYTFRLNSRHFHFGSRRNDMASIQGLSFPPGGFPVASWTSSGSLSGSPRRNARTKSEPNRLDNRTTFENALMAIPTHGGIETQPSASRSVWCCAANSRREPAQDIPIETHANISRTQDMSRNGNNPSAACDDASPFRGDSHLRKRSPSLP